MPRSASGKQLFRRGSDEDPAVIAARKAAEEVKPPPAEPAEPSEDPDGSDMPTDIRDGEGEEPPLREDDAGRPTTTESPAQPWPSDPFAALAGGFGLGQKPAKQEEVSPHEPGTRATLTDEKLAREGMTEYPDDMLVNVKLWKVDSSGVAGDPIMYVENVLYSVAKHPLLWMEYGGRWYMRIIHPVKKTILKQTPFRTPGDPAPDNYRPKIARGDDMDRNALVSELITLGIIKPGQFQQAGFPAGAVPQGVYGDVQGQIAKLEAKIERLETERNNAVQAKNDAERRHDLKESEVKSLDKEVRQLEAQIVELKSDLKDAGKNVTKGDGKPEWAWAAEAFRRDDSLTAKDLIPLLRHREDDGGKTSAMADLNTAMEFIDRARKAAGVGPGGTTGEDTLDKALGLFSKGADIIQKRQRLAEIESSRQPPARQLPPGQQPPAQAAQPAQLSDAEQDKVALERTINKILDNFRAKLNAEVVGRRLAAAAIWARELDMTAADPQVKGFLGDLTATPEKLLVWFGDGQDPKVPADYCREVSKHFRVAMNMGSEEVATPPHAAPAAPLPVDPLPVAEQGKGGGDGKPDLPPPAVPPAPAQPVQSAEPAKEEAKPPVN